MKNEKELALLFDTLDTCEFDELVGDIDLKLAPSDISFGKGQTEMKKSIKKKTIASCIALAAALGIVGAVGAYSGAFGTADHDSAVKSVLGDDYQSSDGYVGEQKDGDEGHLKITNERVLCDGANGLVVFTVEPIDDAGAGELEYTEFIELDHFGLKKNDGKYVPMTDNGNYRGVFDSNGCKVVYWSFGYEPTDESLTAEADIDLTITDKHIVNGDGKEVSRLEFDVEKNVDTIDLASDKGNKVHLNEFSLTVESLENMKELESDTPGLMWKDMPIDKDRYGSGRMIKLIYDDGDDKYITTDDLLDTRGQLKSDVYGGVIVDMYEFKNTIDTDDLTAIEINGERFEAQQK
ncbi:MAG: hypothetical protein IJ740_16055 [Ruminococcus sp.]|nr:hypothetical protein [Ruminococcus sp.]